MNKPSRRSVVRTGVWAVPVVATAAAAPSFAGTGTPPVTIGGVGQVCKLPGNGQHSKDYRFTIYFSSSSSTPLVVTINDVDFKGVHSVPDPDTVTIPAGSQNMQFEFTLYGYNDSSSNPVATITYTVNTVQYTAQVEFMTSTPIKPCPDH